MNFLLEKSMVSTADDPDAAISLWLSVAGDDVRRLIQEILSADEVNDDSRQRAWAQAVRRAEDLGPEFFLDQLPPLFTRSDSPATQKAVVNDRAQVSALFDERDARYELGKALLDGLIGAPSNELKTEVGQWIQEISAEGVLAKAQSREALSDVDVAVLHKVFPSHKKIARLHDDMQKRDAEKTES